MDDSSDFIDIVGTGPELYLAHSKPPEVAEAKWKSINTYVALLAKSQDAQKIPALAGSVKLAITTLFMALEHSPNTRLGRNVDLHVPAAAQWFSIASEEIEELCKNATVKMQAGDLWTEQGGSDVADLSRLEFWQQRLVELGYGVSGE